MLLLDNCRFQSSLTHRPLNMADGVGAYSITGIETSGVTKYYSSDDKKALYITRLPVR